MMRGLVSAWRTAHTENRHVQPASSARIGLRNIIVKINWAEKLRQNVHQLAESLGNLFVETFHYLALFAIGAVTAWAAVMEFLGMLEEGHIKIDDILLLFIYLELGAMVGIYFKTNHMPVRFLIYVAITALTRLLISNVSHHNPPDMGIIYLCGGILLLAFSILVVRYASSQFPSVKIEKPQRKLGAGSGEHRDREGRALKAHRRPRLALFCCGGGGSPSPLVIASRIAMALWPCSMAMPN
jgi:phosphate starvation-inducible membrane PsiE